MLPTSLLPVGSDMQAGRFASTRIGSLKGITAFHAVLKTVYENLDREEQVEKRLNQYKTYFSKLEGKSVKEVDLTEVIKAAYTLEFPQAESPIISYFQSICSALSVEAKTKIQATTTDSDRLAQARQAVQLQLSTVKKIVQQYQAKNTDIPEEKAVELNGFDSESGQYLKYFDSIFSERPYLARYLDCSGESVRRAQQDSALANYMSRRSHPYIDSGDDPQTHGTHVSGIIARQSKKIDIFPIRVMTSSPSIVPAVLVPLKAQVKAQFKNWLTTPDTFSALNAHATRVLGRSFGSADDLSGQFETYLDAQFTSKRLDFQFFDQILQAIEQIGKNQIKVA
ncbi:MAG: hypothetical protein EOP04_32485, partial [Proteobacteria bacterium]